VKSESACTGSENPKASKAETSSKTCYRYCKMTGSHLVQATSSSWPSSVPQGEYINYTSNLALNISFQTLPTYVQVTVSQYDVTTV